MMLAGPQLLSIIPNVGDVILDGDVRHVSPRELIFRFDQGQNLDPFTVASTHITAVSGFFIADGQTFTINGRVFEFDRIGGTTNPAHIPVPYTLASTAATVATNMATAINNADFGVRARADGNTVKLINAVTVSAAPLAVGTQTAFRIERSGSNRDPVFGNGNDVTILPGFLGIGQRPNEVVFRFREDLPDDFYRITIIGAGPNALTNVGHDDEPPEPFNDGFDMQIGFRLDLGPVVTAVVPMPITRLGGTLFQSPNTIEVYFNHDDLDLASAQNTAFYQLIVTQGTADPSDDQIILPLSAVYDPDFSQGPGGTPLGGRVVLTFGQALSELGTGTFRLRIGTDEAPLPAPTVINITPSQDPGDTWGTAWQLGSLGLQTVINSEILSTTPYPVIFPGGVGDPGHRNIPVTAENHVPLTPDTDPTIPTFAYNFQDIYGTDPTTGLPLHNLITEVQKQRVREIFELFGYYLGVQFVETAASGFTIVTGDTRVLAPSVPPGNLGGIAGGGMAIMNGSFDWGLSEYGGAYFRTAFHEIGHLLGLEHTYDLPPVTLMGSADEFGAAFGSGEPVFPGDHDIVHGQYLYRPDSRDIDIYTFVINTAGVFTAETLAERRTRGSPIDSVLDSVLTLYNELNVLLLPVTGGAAIGDGQRFTISDGINIVVFEFDSNGFVTPGNVAIPFTSGTSLRDLATAMADAINSTALNVTAEFGADRVVLTGPVSVSGITAPTLTHRIERKVIAQNDDYFGNDSYLELYLRPGRYYLGVSSKGNTQYNPNSPDSGYGGTTEGPYQLRLGHRPETFSSLVDATGQALDGDADGVAGGVFNFWFQVGNTIYVDKAATPGGDGSLLLPFDRIDVALATAANRIVAPAAGGQAINDGELLVLNFTDGITPPLVFEFDNDSSITPGHVAIPFTVLDTANDLSQRIFSAIEGEIPGGAFSGLGFVDVLAAVTVDRTGSPALFNEPRIVRILGNPGADNDLRTPGDALPYLLGRDLFGPLADGEDMDIPQGVTVMIDAGAVIKLRDTNIDVGRSTPTIDRSAAALQVLGTPASRVVFTSFHDDTAGGISDAPNIQPAPGDWGGLVFRDESDHEAQAIFLNYVNQADIRYGGGQIVVDSVRSIYNPIHLETARPTITNNLIRFSADAAMSADPNSFEDAPLSDPSLAAAYVLDYQRIGPHIRDNRVIDNSLNGLFVRILTPAGDNRLALDLPARMDDVDIVHIIADTLLIRGTPGGGLETEPRLDARLRLDPGLIVKLQGASIETRVGGQLIAEGLPGLPVIFTSLRDDRYGMGGTFDTNNDGGVTLVNRGDWGGLAFGPTSSASIDHAILTYGGGPVTIEGGFASFNVLEIRQADVRLTNSYIAHNANGLDTSNRDGRLRNHAATIFVRGAQPIIVQNVFDDNTGATIHINVNALHSFIRPDYGRSTGPANRFEQFADNAGPLVRLNRIGNNTRNTATNGMLIRGGILTTQGVWDDTDIVHVLLDEVRIDNIHAYGGLRIQSSATESLVVKLQGSDAGITARGTPGDIADRLGGVLHVVGLPGKPVIFTSLGDDTVGAGLTPDGFPQNDTNNTGAGGTGTAGPVFIDGGDRDDHGRFNAQTGENEDGWKFIEQALNFTYSGSLNTAGNGVLVIGADPGTKAGDAITSAATVLNIPITFANDAEISTVDFTQFKVIYVPSVGPGNQIGNSGVQGGITNAELALLTARKQDVQDFVNITGGGLMALTEAGAAQPYAWLELPLPFVINTNINGNEPLAQTPLLAAAGFTITDQELNNGTPWHNAFVGPPGFNGLEVWVVSTVNNHVVTLGLPPGSAGIGAPPPTWRSLRIATYGGDRNVAVVNEFEPSVIGGVGTNNTPSTAQFLGMLAPNEKSGDDVLRLGFQVHGTIAIDTPTDVDVYSFRAIAGTEVWIDIDRTSPALDTVVELINQAGTVLARSNDSFFETQAVLNSLLPGNLARPLERDAWPDRDHYTTNLKDAGFRVVLPGTVGTTNTYFVRVRSMGTSISSTTTGLTSGVYQLQIRLRELDEFPGSVIDTADIRFAQNGVEIIGMPMQSPLIAEAGETSAFHGTFATAQELGNLLVSDRTTINVGGTITSPTQVDWYTFTLDFENIQAIGGVNTGGKTWATIFDIDYADGLVRPDLILSVYDSSGTLIYVGRDSDIADDRPAPGQGHHLTDLSRLSVGGLDPFIGSVHLPEGNGQRYFVAVHSNAIMPDVLNYTLTVNAAQPLARLEPIASVRRIVEDHIGHLGFTSGNPTLNPLAVSPVTPLQGPLLPITTAEQLALHVRPFTLGDVVLYASTFDPVTGASQLHLYNPSSGGLWATQGGLPSQTQDLAIRTDGRMFTYQNLPGVANTGGEVDEINFATLAVTNNVARDGLSDAVAVTDTVDAFAFRRTGRIGDTPQYDTWYSVALPGDSQLSILVGPTAVQPAIMESGFVFYGAPRSFGETRRPLDRATDQGTGFSALDLMDGQTFTINDGVNPPVVFEFNSGPQINVLADGDDDADTDGNVDLEGVQFRVTLSGAANGTFVFELTSDTVFTAPHPVTFASSDSRVAIANAIAIAINNAITSAFGFAWVNATASWERVTVGSLNPAVNISVTPVNVPSVPPTLSIQNFSNGVTPGRVRVHFEADDTAEEIANAMVAAINGVGGQLNSTASVERDVRGVYVAVQFASNVTENVTGMVIDGQGPGGRITGLAWLGDTLYAVSRNGGFYTVNTTTGRLNYLDGDDSLWLTDGLRFEALTLGPQNLDFDGNGVGGDLANTLFAYSTARGGELVALRDSGVGSNRDVRFPAFDTPDNLMVLPVEGGAAISEGQGFALSDGTPGSTTAFVFDLPGGQNFTQTPVLRVISITSTMTRQALATAIANAINGAPLLGVTATALADGVLLSLPVNVLGSTTPAIRFTSDGIRELAIPMAAPPLTGFVSGIAFSPLDFNLWHPTTRRGLDAGHGINPAPDLSRAPQQFNTFVGPDGTQFTQADGGASFYFGLENYSLSTLPQFFSYGANQGQYGVRDDLHLDLASNPAIRGTYNLPGGAYGSLVTAAFSLEGYKPTDKPTLYFNYLLSTEGFSTNQGDMRDSARVWISTDGGATWPLFVSTPNASLTTSLLATNNLALDSELPEFLSVSATVPSTDFRQQVQPLFNTGGGWRQARIDLSNFAGMNNLVLRFDFSTAGTVLDNTVGDSPFADTTQPYRAENNSFEGFYIDDIIIGLTERGEMVTGATPNVSVATVVPSDPNGPQQILTGPYQLEIRRGHEFGVLITDLTPDIVYLPSDIIDSNDRITTDFSLFMPDPVRRTQIVNNPGTVANVTFSGTPLATSPGTLTVEVIGDLDATDETLTISLDGGAVVFSGQFAASGLQGRLASTTLNLTLAQMQSLTADGQITATVTRSAAVSGIRQLRLRLEYSALGGLDGQFFQVSNGVDLVTFEFNVTGGVAGGRVPINLTGTENAAQIAAAVAQAINTHNRLGTNPVADRRVFAASYPTAGRVDLFGVANLITTGAPSLTFTQYRPIADHTLTRPVGDRNMPRVQGQVQVRNTRIFSPENVGILVDAGPRDANGSIPHPGAVQNTSVLNSQRLVPGITLVNNLIVGLTSTGVGILFSGDPNTNNNPAVPFGRIVNNTIVGSTGNLPRGTGISVTENAGPTILNNILYGLITGIAVDDSSLPTTVVGATLYQRNQTNTAPANLSQTFAEFLANNAPLFLDPGTNNFYLAPGTRAIDSSVNSLPDRTAMTVVTGPMGIPPSPILAPDFDMLGQLRVDDPTVAPPPGLGANVFKDRGALERADNFGPNAVLLQPRENDPNDQERVVPQTVHYIGQTLAEFAIQLVEGVGSGVKDSTVVSDRVRVRQNGRLLREGFDYFFRYDSNNDIIRLVAGAGIWLPGNVYTISLDNGVVFDTVTTPVGITDLAGNLLRPNQPNGATQFTIILDDLPNNAPVISAPAGITLAEDSAFVFNPNVPPFIGIQVFDVDAGVAPLQVTLNSTNGTLTLGTVAGLTFIVGDGVADASMIFTGTLTAINSALVGLTYVPAPDYNGPAIIQIIVNDLGNSGVPFQPKTTSATISVTVTPVNDAPIVLNPIPDVTVIENSLPSTLDLSNTFFDIDGDPLTLSVVANSNPTLVTTSLVGTTLTLTYRPKLSGTAVITVRAQDPSGLFVNDTFLVTVLPVNDPPFLVSPIPDVVVDEDAPPTFINLAAHFSDPDLPGDVLTFSVVNNTNPLVVSTAIIGSTLRLTYLPDRNGVLNVTVRATDQANAFAETTFTVTVNPVNDAPVPGDDTYFFEVNRTLVVTAPGVLMNDTDVDNDPLTAVLFDVPRHGQLALNPDGSFVYTPDRGFNGIDRFQYRVDDGTVRVTANVRLLSLDARWVMRLYAEVLGRTTTPSDAEILFWTGELARGRSRGDVALGFINSVERRSREINNFYLAYLGRGVDPSGLQFWLQVWAANNGPEPVQAGLLGSMEYFINRGGGTNPGFVQALYNDVLGRSAGPAEVAFWVNTLATRSRAEVAMGFLVSDEYRLKVISNMYLTYLRRPIDNDGAQYWLQRMKQGVPQEAILAGILGSLEYYNLV